MWVVRRLWHGEMRRRLINLVTMRLGGKFRNYNQVFMLDLMRRVALDETPDILSPEIGARVVQFGLRLIATYTW